MADHPVPGSLTPDSRAAAGDAIAVHLCRLQDLTGLDPEQILDAGEWSRFRHYARSADRMRLLGSRLLSKVVLAQATGQDPAEVHLGTHHSGRPLLSGDPRWQLSLTHSAEVVGIAVGQGQPLGLDLESMEPGLDCLHLAQRFFTSAESLALGALPAAARAAAFSMLWTGKEAVAKASGIALDVALQCDLSRLLSGQRACELSLGAVSWLLRLLETWHGCALAVAQRTLAGGECTIRNWTCAELIAAWRSPASIRP